MSSGILEGHTRSCGGRCPGTVAEVLAVIASPLIVARIRNWDDPLDRLKLDDPCCRVFTGQQITDMLEHIDANDPASWPRYLRLLRMLDISVGVEG